MTVIANEKDEDRRVQAAAELLARREARASLAAYTRYMRVLPPPAAHHLKICERLEALERGEISRLMIFMPPGSAKSSYGSVMFPSWYIGRNPTKSLIAASHGVDLAERFGRRVRNIISEPRYAHVFRACRLSSDSQAAGRWATTEGGEYYAAGVGTGILGFRADLAIIDDPVAGRDDADSEVSREKIWGWYRDDLKTRLKPGGGVVIIMQRWHEDDLAGKLLEDAKKGGDQWEVLRLPMEAEEDDILGREVGEPLWPEYFTESMRDQARRDPRSWLALYQQRPRPDSGGEFKREWIQTYKNRPDRGVNTYILVDPAGEKKKVGKSTDPDYTAMFVVGLAADQNLYVLDIIRDRLNLTERTDQLFKWHREYRPLRVGYEKYGKDSDIEHIKDRQERENYRFPVVPLGGAMRKADRIRRLIPLFQAGRIWLPEKLIRTDSTGRARDLVQEFIEEEYAAFNVCVHDDMLDCLSRIEDPMLTTVFPKEGPKTNPFARPLRVINSPHSWAA